MYSPYQGGQRGLLIIKDLLTLPPPEGGYSAGLLTVMSNNQS